MTRKLTHFLPALALLLAAPAARAQAPAWQQALGLNATSTAGTPLVRVQATSADAAGNVYVAGRFATTLQLGSFTLTATGASTGFVAKWSPSQGKWLWAYAVGGAEVAALALGSSLSGTIVYVAGTYQGETKIGRYQLPPYDAFSTKSDVFVAKLEANIVNQVDVQWADRLAGAGNEQVAGLTLAQDGFCVALNFDGPSVRFISQTLTNAAPGTNTSDVAVARIAVPAVTGTCPWAVRAGGTGDDRAFSLAGAGTTLYLGGQFEGTATFAGAAVTSAGGTDGFVARLLDNTTSAAFDGVQRLGSAGDELVQCLALDAAAGSPVYVGGGYTGTQFSPAGSALPNAGGFDGFVARLTLGGSSPATVSWVQRLGGPGNDVPTALLVRGGSVYAAGVFNLPANGAPAAGGTATIGTTTLTAAGGSDVFLTRLTEASAGTSTSFAWAQQAGGPGNEYPTGLTAGDATLTVGGYFAGASATFGATALANPASAGGGLAGFVASLTDPLLPTRAAAAPAGLAVYPSPAHDAATVQVPAGAGVVSVQVLDALGRVVRSQPAPAGAACALSLAGLAPGLYAVQAGAATGRLVVE